MLRRFTVMELYKYNISIHDSTAALLADSSTRSAANRK